MLQGFSEARSNINLLCDGLINHHPSFHLSLICRTGRQNIVVKAHPSPSQSGFNLSKKLWKN